MRDSCSGSAGRTRNSLTGWIRNGISTMALSKIAAIGWRAGALCARGGRCLRVRQRDGGVPRGPEGTAAPRPESAIPGSRHFRGLDALGKARSTSFELKCTGRNGFPRADKSLHADWYLLTIMHARTDLYT